MLDTSAILAILFDEPERRAFNEKIVAAEKRFMSAGTYLETNLVLESRAGYEGVRDLQYFLDKASILIVPFDAEQAELAGQAYRRYGKGRHPAGLNFGDCFAYALATLKGEPLLFKGEDFSKTDITPC